MSSEAGGRRERRLDDVLFLVPGIELPMPDDAPEIAEAR